MEMWVGMNIRTSMISHIGSPEKFTIVIECRTLSIKIAIAALSG
jgi:hypothetical protein